jgi:hypothetical protein
MGRPTEIPDRVKLEVYMTARERRRITQAAKRAKVSASAWMRGLALVALEDRHGGAA